MKRIAAILVVAAVALVGWWLVVPANRSDDRTEATHASPPNPDPPTAVITDGVEIFKKAFWKRPGADDKILHAERREWADTDGVRKWQWFLAVEPSPALVKYLREDNPFSLSPGPSMELPSESPEWFSFKPGDVEILQAPGGRMRLCFSKSSQLLYATDGGGGFAKGVESQMAKPIAQTGNPGRIPSTPPPTPERP